MNPIQFPEQNVILAEHQDDYQPLPVLRSDDGVILSCWSLTWRERFKIFFAGKMWINQMTFGSLPHPILPQISTPNFKAFTCHHDYVRVHPKSKRVRCKLCEQEGLLQE